VVAHPFATRVYNPIAIMVPSPEFYWHTTPLQFLPEILTEGALRASAHPRPTALSRRRKLGLESYVHLSFSSQTPLLADKLPRGYPHALLAFSPEISQLTGAAYLKYNTKRWAHREEFIPITDPTEKQAFLIEWRTGRYPSAELLIPEQLLLTHAAALVFASQAEADWLTSLSLPTPPITIAPERFPSGPIPDLTLLWEWRESCERAGALLPPPDLPFD